MKEMRFRPNIAEHDLKVKLNKVKKFIEKKHRVKLTMFFKGREMAHKDLGEEKMKKMVNELKDFGASINSPLKFKGNNATVILDAKG